jgi:hypothetical protein
MKNLLLIIVLLSLQCACASQPQATGHAPVLLSFSELANEITVGFEDIGKHRRADRHANTALGTP